MATEATIKINIDSKNATNNIGKLQDDLQATRQELDRVIKTYGENSKQADTLRKSVAGLEIELSKLGVASEEVSTNTQSLKAELRQLQNELAKLEPGSARFVQLSQRAGELKDQIADANAVVGQLAGNVGERLFNGITSTVQIGVAGFSAVQSAIALTGVESEELQQTMVRLQALLNLSQSLQTLSGLPDEITKIRAAFGSLTTATKAQNLAQTQTAVSAGATAVAMEGEAVAATGAAASTSLFATALNALPLVGIVAAIGAVVYGLYQYATATGETTEQKEKQRKETEELNKKIQEENENIGENAGAYIPLIFQLKNTNKNSKERKTLIKEINDTYGTTFKNLQDETEFQSQLNISIKEYIALQVLKARAQAKEKEQAAAVGALIKAQDELTKFQNTYAGMSEKEIADYDQKRYGVSVYSDGLNKLTFEVSRAQAKAEEYAISSGDLQKEIDKLTLSGKKYTEQTNHSTKSTDNNKEATEKYADLLDEVKNKINREIAVQQTLDKITSERIDNTLTKETDAINKQYGDERQNIINRAIEREIRATEEKFKKEGKTEEQYRTQIQSIRDNYQTYLLDSEKNLLDQLETFRKEDLTNLQNTYTLQEQIVLNNTQQILENTRLLELEYQKQAEIDAVDATTQTEEVKNQKKLEIRKKYADQEIAFIKSLAQKEQQALDLQLQQTLTKEGITQQEKEQAQAKYSQDTIKLAQETADKINEINTNIKSPIPETPQAKIDSAVAQATKYVDTIASLYNQLSNVIQMATESQFGQRQDKIDEAYKVEKESLEGSLEQQIITREQYDSDIARLDQKKFEEEKQLKKEQFEISKKLQITNAIIQGAQAVLAAYSSGVAVPIAGITLGPINAALAGAIAAAQLAVISNQQFTAAEGGIVPGYGPGNIDSVPSLLAPGEAVINSQSAQMFPNLISQINEAGGGKSLVPDLPPKSASQQTPNVFVQKEMNQPIKAFVVETDISDSQRRINRIKQSVEF
jgi:hypothetical protein